MEARAHLELVHFLNVFFYFFLEVADAGAARLHDWLLRCKRVRCTGGGAPVGPNAVRLQQFDIIVVKRLNLDSGIIKCASSGRAHARAGTSFSSSSGFSLGVGMLLANASGGRCCG